MTTWYWDAATTQQQALYADRDGTLAKPWVLGPGRFGINDGAMDISVFSPGDTLYIRGTHVWSGFDTHFNCTGINGLIIRGDYPSNPGRITGMALTDFDATEVRNLSMTGLTLIGGDGLVFDNCVVNGGTKGIVLDPGEGCDNVTISNCEVYDHTHQGMELFTTPGVSRDNWLIENNHVYNIALATTNPDVDGEGIGIQRFTNSTIRNNRIHHADYGINLFESGTGVVHGLTISGNTVHHILTGPVGWPSRGIMMSGGTTTEGSLYDITVADNLVYVVGREGIRLQGLTGATGLVCENNRVADVNREFGTKNSQHIVAPAPWVLSGNTTQSSRAGAAAARRRR